jgi:NAD(P)-dependent dehydrogenase (short-subunit alcohol dehydrogenase family)
VIGVARSLDELQALQAETGGGLLQIDLAVPSASAYVAGEVGTVDILVNNAGIGSAGEGRVWEQDPARWRQAMSLNLDVPFELTRLLLPGMLERGWGRIVNVASLAALPTGVAPGMSAYAASKHGLLGLTRATAIEVSGTGVTCNAVMPGSVRTRTAELRVAEEAAAAGTGVEEAWQRRAERTTAGRLITPEEVAAAVGFLASEAAGGVNGEALGVALQASG